MLKFNQDHNIDEIEFEGIEELSDKELSGVSGGPVVAGLFTVIKLGIALGKGIAVGASIAGANDEEKRASWSGNSVNRTPTWNRSDKRLKQQIIFEGAISGLDLNVYSWEYKVAPGERFVGVMAQDLLAREDLRSAVFKFADGPFEGFYGVNYAKLGLACLPVEAWDGEVASLIVDAPVLA